MNNIKKIQSKNSKRGRIHLKTLQSQIAQDLEHWTRNSDAVNFIKLVSSLGAYKHPIETGIKAKYTRLERMSQILEQQEEKKKQVNQDIGKYIQKKNEEMKKYIERLQQYAHTIYNITESRDFYFIQEKDQSQILKLDNFGHLIQEQNSAYAFSFNNKNYVKLEKALNQISFLLNLSFCQNLRSLVEIYINKNNLLCPQQIIEHWLNVINEKKIEYRELQACQFVKDGKREMENEINRLKNDPQEVIQIIRNQILSKSIQKDRKQSKAIQKTILKEIDENDDLKIISMKIDSENVFLRNFLAKLYEFLRSVQVDN